MAAMAALAGRTRRLRFGMNVVSLALRDPVLLAKQCATIDVLSEGRLLPAFGIGSPLGPEWQALDIDTKTRGRRTDESAGDHRPAVARGQRRLRGQALSAKGASISPKPVQPDLPMWIGGSSEAAIRRTAHVRHRLAGRRRDAGGRRPGRRRHQEGRAPRPAAPSTRITTARLSRSISAAPATASCRPRDGRLRQTHRPRSQRLLRGRRRRQVILDRVARIRGGRRREIHPAPRRAGRRRRSSPRPGS